MPRGIIGRIRKSREHGNLYCLFHPRYRGSHGLPLGCTGAVCKARDRGTDPGSFHYFCRHKGIPVYGRFFADDPFSSGNDHHDRCPGFSRLPAQNGDPHVRRRPECVRCTDRFYRRRRNRRSGIEERIQPWKSPVDPCGQRRGDLSARRLYSCDLSLHFSYEGQ